jgi:hypothetical protein
VSGLASEPRLSRASRGGILGVHVLTATWRFIPATEIEINPELTPIVQEIITKPEMNKHGAQMTNKSEITARLTGWKHGRRELHLADQTIH